MLSQSKSLTFGFSCALTFLATISSAAPTVLTSELEARNAATATAADNFSCKLTWYYPSVGCNSCGWIELDSALITALSPSMMGAQSNGNPNCNRTINVSANGRTISVRAVDKCSICGYSDLDLSPGAWEALGFDLGLDPQQATWNWA